jgi:glycerophosphoryl diester phosphodiesterase
MKNTLIFAHRGANHEAAENTRTAFEKALNYPIDGIETDVQLSRDEVAVLWHDTFLRKLGMPEKHIDDFDYAQLQAMNFAAHFSSVVAPEGIMSLKDFLAAYRKRCRLLIEIKNRAWESPARHEIKVRQTLDQMGKVNQDTLIASSFNLLSLVYANLYRPGFPLVYNLEPEQTLEEASQVLSDHPFLHGLCLPIANLSQSVIELLRHHNKCIAVYTCNSNEEISKALEFGVDILISDVPQKALQMRNTG